MNMSSIITLLIISIAITLALLFMSKNKGCSKICDTCPYSCKKK